MLADLICDAQLRVGSTPSFPSSSLQGHILPAGHLTLEMMGPLSVGPRGVEEATQEGGQFSILRVEAQVRGPDVHRSY